MKILVFSDSHGVTELMEDAIDAHMKNGGVDLLVHLGDGTRDFETVTSRYPGIKKIAVAGIAAAFTLTATSCNDFVSNIIGGPLQGDIPMPETSHETVDGEMPSVKEEISETATMGDVAPEESDYWQETPGEAMPEESEVSEEIEEMGELPAEEASQEVSEVEHTMGDPAPGYYD